MSRYPTTIKAISVKAFELFSSEGASLGLFIVKDQWKGMIELVSVNDKSRTVILDAPSPVDELFGSVFGEQRSELTIMKASPMFIDLTNRGYHGMPPVKS